MIGLDRLKRINWRLVGATFCAASILHIMATLAAPQIVAVSPFERLARKLPVNTMQILPPVTANTQPLPFMAPDSRYAMCRFDSTSGQVQIAAVLPAPGWTLSLHSKEGDNFYTAVAQPGRSTEVSLVLIPTDERFTGLTPEATGKQGQESRSLTLVAPEGIAIVRAPDMGHAFRSLNEAELARARCSGKRS